APRAVRRVVLCCTFTKLRWNTLRVANAVLTVTPGSIFSFTAPLSMRVVCGPVGDGSHHPFFDASRNADKRGVIKRTGWQIGRDFSPDIAAVKQPMLILMGARDRFVPNASREVAKLRQLLAHQDATVRVIPDAGHVILPSAAIACVVEEIGAFLDGTVV
ncbi:MAG: alpha/beta hydrolase, partial [Solirubrobacteraceae bacterium]